MDNQCPCCAARLLAEKAYESAERKASDHERDLIKLRGELSEALAENERLHAELANERKAWGLLHNAYCVLEEERPLLIASRLRLMRTLGMVLKQRTTE